MNSKQSLILECHLKELSLSSRNSIPPKYSLYRLSKIKKQTNIYIVCNTDHNAYSGFMLYFKPYFNSRL